jgi:hypothetical protein
MAPVLLIHIGAGGFAIFSGVAAVAATKGGRLHRLFGTIFLLSMLTASVLAVYLTLFVPSTAPGRAPTSAAVSVAILTCYLVATAWVTVRRSDKRVGLFEKGAFAVVCSVAVVLLIFGLLAARLPMARPGAYVPYFVFASFAAFAGILDFKVILSHGIAGASRIARHLWRMCFAFFFATSFFFIGQQRIMPAFLHGGPLLVPALAPLAIMIFWLVRTRVGKRSLQFITN